MPVLVNCPNPECGRRSRVADSLTGRNVRCKACGQTFIAGDTVTHDSARSAPPVMPPGLTEIGSVGRFRLQTQLGSGAFGTVYRAYDPHLDREVALKVPHPGTLDRPQRVERFLREAKAAANLRHPHIVAVYDAGKDGDRYYIASAFIDGKPLADEIPAGGLPFSRAARVAYELAGAVGYAHEQGVVHRDIKPANVMMDDLGRPHLMDFGLAARSDEASKLTTDGAVLGTPAYMAPEQAAGQQGEASPLADQYALGVVLYELLTGRVPFSGPVPVVIHNQIHTEPDPPRKHRPDVPRDLETICLKALSKRPEDRYPDCDSLADDLRRWLEGEPIAARPLSGRERLTRWVRKNPVVAGLTAAVAVLLVVGTVAATLLAIEANSAAREAMAARDSEREASESLLLETANARQARAEAEAHLEAARQAEATTRAALADAEDAAEHARESQAISLEKQWEAEEHLARFEQAERDRILAANQLKGIEIIKEERDYCTAVVDASRAITAGESARAKEELAKCPERVRGPEWHMLSDWAAAGKQPGREIVLPWPKWDGKGTEGFHYNSAPKFFLSPDLTHAALVFTKGGPGTKPETLVRVFTLESPPRVLADLRFSKDNFFGEKAPDNNAITSVTFDRLAFSPDNKTFVTLWTILGGAAGGMEVSISGRYALIRHTSGKGLHRLTLPSGWLYCLRGVPDGRFVVALGGALGKMRTVNFGTDDHAVTEYDAKVQRYNTFVERAISEDGQWLVLTTAGVVRIFDTSSGKEVGFVPSSGRMTHFGFTEGNNPHLAVLTDRSSQLYQAPADGGEAWTLVPGSVSESYDEVRLSPDGARVLTRTRDGANRATVSITDPRDGFKLCTLTVCPAGPALQKPQAKYAVTLTDCVVDPSWRRWVGWYSYAEGKYPTTEGGTTRLWVWEVGTAKP